MTILQGLDSQGSPREGESVQTQKTLGSHTEGTVVGGSKMATRGICSPHDDLNDLHGCVTQSTEEIHQNLSLFSHFSNDKSEDEAKDNQAQDVYAI